MAAGRHPVRWFAVWPLTRNAMRINVNTETRSPHRERSNAFIAYAGTHVAQWPERAALHYLTAMQEAFPCKDDRK